MKSVSAKGELHGQSYWNDFLLISEYTEFALSCSILTLDATFLSQAVEQEFVVQAAISLCAHRINFASGFTGTF